MVDSIILKRLAFIKYIYTIALQQSQQPEPLSSASILAFHDSIELFLQLAAEHLNSDKKVDAFMEYWEVLKPKLPNEGLTQKESMRRLNGARVSLKHHGTLPSKLSIEGFRVNSIDFFRENSLLVFGLNFDNISLIDLVSCDETRLALQEAFQLLQEEKLDDALEKIAIAFSLLIRDYENRKRNDFGKSPFFFGQSLTFHSSSSMSIKDYKLGQFIDRVKESLENMQEAMKIMSFGIDYRRYVKYRLFVPNIVYLANGTYNLHKSPREKTLDYEDVKFCFDFVIDSAITLQEFDFTIPKSGRDQYFSEF